MARTRRPKPFVLPNRELLEAELAPLEARVAVLRGILALIDQGNAEATMDLIDESRQRERSPVGHGDPNDPVSDASLEGTDTQTLAMGTEGPPRKRGA